MCVSVCACVCVHVCVCGGVCVCVWCVCVCVYLLLAGESISPKRSPHLLLLLLLWVAAHHVVESRHVQIKVVLEVLVITPCLEVGMATNQAISGNQLMREYTKDTTL